VKRTPAEATVSFLSFSGDCSGRLGAIEKFSAQEWTRVLQWLDDSGLAFYFLQKLEETNATNSVPTWARSHLRQNFAANQARVENMSRRFGLLNSRFDDAGIRYVVLKGFSLVPEFCSSAPRRHQGDFDYLVKDDSLAAARRVVLDAGYISKGTYASKQSVFVSPGGEASRDSQQYSAQAPHAVELHTDVWEPGLHGVLSIADLFSIERARTKQWGGFVFPALTDEEAFLLQVVHACHHFFTLWIRMSCLFEIAYFLNGRAGDTELWSRVEERVGANVVLREFVVIVSEMAARLFAVPIPPLVQAWGSSLRPASRTWIEHYGRRWAFSELPVYEFSLFPSSKLALFLRQQYEERSESSERKHASPTFRLTRIASSIRNEPSLILNTGWWRRQLLVRRSIFYALASARYVCEIPRWRWLNRAGSQRAGASLDRRIRGKSLDSDFRATN
jgi:hypothetical protein